MKVGFIFLALFISFSLFAQKNKMKEGKKAPTFQLMDCNNQSVSLEELLDKNESVVVFFYIGSWLKYDVAYLESIQSIYKDMKSKNSEVVAITRESAGYIQQVVALKELAYPVVMDDDWYTIGSYGVSNKISQGYVPSKYEEFSKMNALHTGKKDKIIPIPATYIIGKDGKVKWSHFDIDYRRRPTTEDILNNL